MELWIYLVGYIFSNLLCFPPELGSYFTLFLADFINKLLLSFGELILTGLFSNFCILKFFCIFLLTSTLLCDRLLFNFFSLLDLFNLLLLFFLSFLSFLPFFISIDLCGDLLRDLYKWLLLFTLFTLDPDFCILSLLPLSNLELFGLFDRLRASLWSYFLFYRTPRFIMSNKINFFI